MNSSKKESAKQLIEGGSDLTYSCAICLHQAKGPTTVIVDVLLFFCRLLTLSLLLTLPAALLVVLSVAESIVVLENILK
jgi:hypothetical protein